MKVVNAFAVPGGYVVVLRGLLEEMRTAEELAGVLATRPRPWCNTFPPACCSRR